MNDLEKVHSVQMVLLKGINHRKIINYALGEKIEDSVEAFRRK